jgi:hypothetical protein
MQAFLRITFLFSINKAFSSSACVFTISFFVAALPPAIVFAGLGHLSTLLFLVTAFYGFLLILFILF